MTDKICGWCDEPILPGEKLAPIANVSEHWECGLRSLIGGVNHLRGRCSCCGGTEDPDPPNLSRRQAARAAIDEWEARGRP